MCNRCTQSWLPMNHRRSHGLTFFGDKFHWQRIFAIRSPFAELRRHAKMKGGLGTGQHRTRLRETRERIEKRYSPSTRVSAISTKEKS